MALDNDKKLKFNTRIKIMLNNSSFGSGVAQIMELVQSTGSLSQAYKTMGLSSSKGWRIIKSTEEELGFSLFETIVGGKGGGGSKLTEKGEDLLNRYKAFIHELNIEAERLYNKYFL